MPLPSSTRPYIVHIPARDKLGRAELRACIDDQIAALVARYSGGRDARSLQEEITLYLEGYPVVYVVHAEADDARGDNEGRYVVYVGETNDIVMRTHQHFAQDPKSREDWRAFAEQDEARQYVIGNGFFNKSLTLDVENRLMHYMSSIDAVEHLINRRTNAQGEYYTHTMFDGIFKDIWLGLHEQDPDLFPAEQIIMDSALFKASPFHALSEDQKEAENAILETLSDVCADATDEMPRLILVGGAAGTGKTVLLSHLFYRIITEGVQAEAMDDDAEAPIDADRRPSAYILVNHNEQRHVYNQIATKLGLQKKDGQVVMKPSAFIKMFSEDDDQGKGQRIVVDEHGKKHYVPQGSADIVLIDEAHLLHTQGNQGYSGSNMLADVLRRAKVVVAIFDPGQILESRQRWSDEDMERFFPESADANGEAVENRHEVRFSDDEMEGMPIRHGRIQLRHQFRIAANDPTVSWLERLTRDGIIGPMPTDEGKRNPRAGRRGEPEWIYEPYDLRVFDSPVELMRAIRTKAEERADGVDGKGLSRVLATYDWAYKANQLNPDTVDVGGQWSVEMYRADACWHMGACEGHARGMGANDAEYFYHPWNYQIADTAEEKATAKFGQLAWAEKPHTIDEIGSTFTIQGFDLNFAGVILGPSVIYNPETERVEFNPAASASAQAVHKRDGKRSYALENLRNELNVLLTRGVHGLYLFAVDPALQAELLKRQRARRINEAV